MIDGRKQTLKIFYYLSIFVARLKRYFKLIIQILYHQRSQLFYLFYSPNLRFLTLRNSGIIYVSKKDEV